MNFVKAVQHATIGYGIRRTSWVANRVLSIDNFGEFYWIGDAEKYILSLDDYIATNWETI